MLPTRSTSVPALAMQRKPSHNPSVNNQTTASRKPCVRRQKLVVPSTLCQTKDPAKNRADRPDHFSSQFHISANHPLPDQYPASSRADHHQHHFLLQIRHQKRGQGQKDDRAKESKIASFQAAYPTKIAKLVIEKPKSK